MHNVYLEYFVVSERYSFIVTSEKTWRYILGSGSEVSVLELLQDP